MAVPQFCLNCQDEDTLERRVMEPPAKRHFSSATEADLAEMDENRCREWTKNTTQKWLRVVRSYMDEKGIDINFKTLSADNLAKFLRQMYVEPRNKDGNV